MQRIGLIADTHGYLDARVFEFFDRCDQVWHAGDFGTLHVSEQLSQFRPLRGVYGNVDDEQLRSVHPLDDRFTCDGVDVWMTHIGGYPGRYDRRVAPLIRKSPPQLFVCGHSHIPRVMRDRRLADMLHLNPGAAGRQGFHVMRTVMRFEIDAGRIGKLQMYELGPRSSAAAAK